MAQTHSILVLYLVFAPWSTCFVSNSSDDLLDVRLSLPDDPGGFSTSNDKCTVQLHTSLEKLRKRQETSRVASLIDLSGYALHQSLRNAPVDMYVTDIKVRAPSVGSWVQVQGCQFSKNAEMKTQLLFNDLLISGVVRLLPGDLPLEGQSLPPPSEQCTMTLRLRRAGLDLKAAPDLGGGAKILGGGLQVRTESNFVHPHFLSVHSYGCRLDQWARDGWFDYPFSQKRTIERPTYNQRASRADSEDEAEIRIITLGQEPDLQDHEENEIYRQRILGYTSPSEKLAAVLGVKKQIAQQTNTIFQTHGPFSQHTKPIFTPHHEYLKPAAEAVAPVSTITELDEGFRPIRPMPQKPFQSLTAPTGLPKLPLYGPPSPAPLQEVSTEMEDVFLRGAKALLAKYLEKQLEVPLKEAIMTKIGYTVSYG